MSFLFWKILKIRLKTNKLQLKGCFDRWPLQIPYVFRIVYPKPFSCLHNVSVIILVKYWMLTWKHFEKTNDAWFQFYIETLTDDFHQPIKLEVLHIFCWDLECILNIPTLTILRRFLKIIRSFELFCFFIPLFSSLRSNISKTMRYWETYTLTRMYSSTR